MESLTVRTAGPADALAVRRVLDAAMLAVDDDLLTRALDGEGVLVAVIEDRVVGALVADTTGARDGTGSDDARSADEGTNDETRGDEGTNDGTRSTDEEASDDAVRGGRAGAHVDAIAVTRRRRARGIGTALVEAATSRWRPLSADFDAGVRPFYEKLGFEIAALDARAGRYRGRLH